MKKKNVYNSVFTCRHIAINSSVSAPLNATKIAVMKDSHGRVVMFGSELLFSMYKYCFLACFFLRETVRTAAKSRTNLSTANGPIGPEAAPPSVFHGHNFIETLQVAIIAGDISNCSYELSVLPLTSAHLSSA